MGHSGRFRFRAWINLRKAAGLPTKWYVPESNRDNHATWWWRRFRTDDPSFPVAGDVTSRGSPSTQNPVVGAKQQAHWDRNELYDNDANVPATLEEAQAAAANGDFVLLPTNQSVFHNQGGANNVKYVSADGHFEAVYNFNTGQLVTGPLNKGTYNINSPTDNPLGHFTNDVLPYLNWGNGPNDPTTRPERWNLFLETSSKTIGM